MTHLTMTDIYMTDYDCYIYMTDPNQVVSYIWLISFTQRDKVAAYIWLIRVTPPHIKKKKMPMSHDSCRLMSNVYKTSALHSFTQQSRVIHVTDPCHTTHMSVIYVTRYIYDWLWLTYIWLITTKSCHIYDWSHVTSYMCKWVSHICVNEWVIYV